MRFISEYRRADLAAPLIARIAAQSRTPASFMEFCGGHTVTIFRYGIRQVVPATITMRSGPGCPVCVTANEDLDRAIALAHVPGMILTTFGDMLKVPGSRSSLQTAKAEGADVRVVYSTLDALEIARDNPQRPVVFLGIGFETTAPTVAASVLEAVEADLENYFVLALHKLSPPAIRVLLDAKETAIDGIIAPGHVSTVVGSVAWEFIASDYGIPCVVTGFEPLDVLKAIDALVAQVEAGAARVEIAYRRAVQPDGNPEALRLMSQVFEPCPAAWRGMGTIPESGLRLRDTYSRFDARERFPVDPGPTVEPKGCLCGDVLRAVKTPHDCPLFATACTPETPVGPCMVSAEGSCSTYYAYARSQTDGR